MSEIVKLKPKLKEARKQRVAAYARVSADSDRLLHSFSNQISYYNSIIKSHPEWDYVGVCSDEAISGGSTKKRKGFQDLIADSEAGLIDIILVKSVSRFARNTVDTLKATRHLKDLGVEVRFEKENVSSFSDDGELMLSLLASFAQAEVESMSENIKWSRKKSFQLGDPQTRNRLLGYEWVEDKLVIQPDEAEEVRRIFVDYLNGKSTVAIANKLNKKKIRTIRGEAFDRNAVNYILRNITYTGNLLLQKTVTVNPLEKKRVRNTKGLYDLYFAEGTHEAIIDTDTFNKVQELMDIHAEEAGSYMYSCEFKYYKKIKCGICGCNYGIRRISGRNNAYKCNCLQRGLPSCMNSQIQESKLDEMFTKLSGLEPTLENIQKSVKQITIKKGKPVHFELINGRESFEPWRFGKEE